MCVDVYIWLHFCVHLITPLFFFYIVLLLRCNIELYWISFLVLSLYPNESSSVLHINETLLCDEKELLKTLMSQISTHSAISRELHSAALWTEKKKFLWIISVISPLCVRAVVILNIWNHERVLSSSSQVKSQLFHLNMMLSSHKWLICNNLMLWLWHPEQNMITVYYVIIYSLYEFYIVCSDLQSIIDTQNVTTEHGMGVLVDQINWLTLFISKSLDI